MTTFLVTILLAWAVERGIMRYAYLHEIFDKPDDRKIHSEQIPRLGGLAFFPVSLAVMFGLRLAGLLAAGPTWDAFAGTLVALLVIYAVGIVDDTRGVRYRVKFAFQALSACLLCLSGFCYTDLHGLFGLHELPPALSWIVTIFAVSYVANAINFIDGIDGLSSSIAVVALAFFAGVFFWVGDTVFCAFALVVLATLVPFMFYNIFGRSSLKTKVFMGDAGSLFLGGVFTVFSIRCSQQDFPDPGVPDGLFLSVAPILLPLLDVVHVVLHRLRAGANPFAADRSHIHHRCMAAGCSQHTTLGIVLALSLLLTAVGVWAAFHVDINVAMLITCIVWLALDMAVSRKKKINDSMI